MTSEGTFKKARKAVALLITLLLTPLLLFQFDDADSTTTARAALPEIDLLETEDTLANCRYGTTPVWERIYEQALLMPRLGAGWIVDFAPFWYYDEIPNNPEYVHLIKTHQKKTSTGVYLQDYYSNVSLDDRLAKYLRNNPGELWLVGNEVDRGPQPGEIEASQGDMFPDMYAVAYHDIYHFIKEHDPTARVAISGLVQVTPGRLQYLDKVWAAYRQKYGEDMPVDVWNMHIYVLPESMPDGVSPNGIASIALGTDPLISKRGSGGNAALCPDDDVYCIAEHDDMEIFTGQVVAMRKWMKDHGQQNKPLILSEYGILHQYQTFEDGRCKRLRDEYGKCFPPERVSAFMTNTFNTFNSAKDPELGYPLDDNRLVQQWLWFAIYLEAWDGFSANLVEKDLQTLTLMGETFRDYVHAEETYVNLIVDEVAEPVLLLPAGETTTATLTVSFRNNGNVAVEEPFRITFYKDEALQEPIDSVVTDAQVRGCATRAHAASIEWAGLGPGVHEYWVKVDSANTVVEKPGNADNTGRGRVVVETGYELDVEIISNGSGEGGTVRLSPDKPLFVQGEQVRLEAVPAVGWSFDGWSGAVNDDAAIQYLAMTNNKKMTATFTQNEYQVTIEVVGDGDVTIQPDEPHYRFGDQVVLEATPGAGLNFAGWGGDLELYNTENPLMIEIVADTSATATFADHLPPVFLPLENVSEDVGESVSFTVGAYDPEGKIPTLSTKTLPAGASFVDSGNGSGRFTWPTETGDAGRYPVVFRASDGELSASVEVVIEIKQEEWKVMLPAIIH